MARHPIDPTGTPLRAIQVRLPLPLHGQLVRAAEEERRSLANLALLILEAWLAQEGYGGYSGVAEVRSGKSTVVTPSAPPSSQTGKAHQDR